MTSVHVERVVRTRQLVPRPQQQVTVRDAEALELLADIAAGRTGQQHEELRHRAAQPLEDADEHIRSLDELRLVAVPEADAVLEERADDERSRRNARTPRVRLHVLVASERKAREIDPDRDAEHLRRIDPGSEHELVHLGVRDLHPVDARRGASAPS